MGVAGLAEVGNGSGRRRRAGWWRLGCGLAGVAVAVGFGALFQHSGQVEYLGGACAALVVPLLSVLVTVADRGSRRGPVDRSDFPFTFLQLSWAPWVVMFLVGVHSVTASYDHDLRPPRNPPLHALGWLVLVATGLLALALLAAHRREGRTSAWKVLPPLLFVTLMAGSVGSAVHAQDIRTALRICACFMP